MKLRHLAAALATAASFAASSAAHAGDTLNLGNYLVFGTYALDIQVGAVSGLEGSAVTWARDRNSLFFVGDEGTGVIEISRTGTTLGSMAFNWTGTGSTNRDTEGLTYLGGGVLVVGEERLQDAYRFSYSNGGTATLASSYVSISNAAVGNNGMEGISYDPRNGGFVTIKQQLPQDVQAGSLSFAAGAGGTSTMANLFNPASLGVTTLSDVQTLSPVDALAGTAAADHLLILSLGSRRLLEVDRAGVVKSSFDLTNVMAHNGIEGVTIAQDGTIFLVAEQIQDGATPFGVDPAKSYLIALAPVPEPDTWALLLAGLAFTGWSARRAARATRA